MTNKVIILLLAIGRFSTVVTTSDANSIDLSLSGVTINGASSYDEFGWSVSDAGDVNGDGYGDIVVGSDYASPLLRPHAGVSYIIYGRATGLTDIDLAELNHTEGFKINGAASGDYSGTSVSAAGDVNGDGFGDVIIGADQASPLSRSRAGASYVIYGKASGFHDIDLAHLHPSEGFTIIGAAAGDEAGSCVGSAGDMNGDGYDDVVIGAPAVSIGKTFNLGMSYVIFGKRWFFKEDIDLASLKQSEGFAIQGAKAGDTLGSAIGTAGDMNGDGFGDLLIGVAAADGKTRKYSGVSYVIFGKSMPFSTIDLSSLSLVDGITIYGADEHDGSGFSVSEAGDMNGDGYGDIVIGAYGAIPTTEDDGYFIGVSYIIYGRATGLTDIDLAELNHTEGFKINGAASGDYSGTSVSAAGDVNGDGFGDVIIGADQASPLSRSRAGASYVIYGKASGFHDIDLAHLHPSEGFTIIGAAAGDEAGWSVSSAGDMNGDGYDDVVIGAPKADPILRPAAGISFVVFGAQTPILTHAPSLSPTMSPSFPRKKHSPSLSPVASLGTVSHQESEVPMMIGALVGGTSVLIFIGCVWSVRRMLYNEGKSVGPQVSLVELKHNSEVMEV